MTPDSPSYSNHKNPQSWNLYTYALNNPLTFRDADGHTIECANNTAQCQKAAQETNSAVQFTKDEAVGMAKVAYNNLADLDNWFYSGVNALLGTNFHVEEAKPATCDYRELRPCLKQDPCGTLIADLFDAHWLPCWQAPRSRR